MSESLLDFSNISLFGQIVTEMKVVYPTKVVAASTKNLDKLEKVGQRVDGVKIEGGDKVLIWQQDNLRENGIYFASPKKWRLLRNIPEGSYVNTRRSGEQNRQTRWVLEKREHSIPHMFEFKVSIKMLGKLTFIDNIHVTYPSQSFSPMLNTPIILNDKEPIIAASEIATAINDKSNFRFTATSSDNSVIIYAPLDSSDRKLGPLIDFDIHNIAIYPKLDYIRVIINPPYQLWNFNNGSRATVSNFRKLGRRRPGETRFLERQINKDSKFARIYGFSFEGTYYPIQEPVIFLVHGNGDLVTIEEADGSSGPNPARSPRATSLTGLAAAGFDFADEVRVWSYDQADYTIRMDVETGMFEQVLLDAMFDGGTSGPDVSGMNARGMNARGMNARGMNARGMNARGMNARGGNSD